MKDTVKNSTGYWKRFLVIAVIVFAVLILTDIISTYVSYPTQAHRAVAKELTALESVPIPGSNDNANMQQNKRIAQLTSSNEAKYTTAASFFTTVLSFVLYVYLTWRVYVHTRRKRFTSRYRLFTIAVIAIGSVLAALVHVPITNAIVGFNATPGGSVIVNIILTTVSILFFTILTVMVVESRYEKRHSLIVE